MLLEVMKVNFSRVDKTISRGVLQVVEAMIKCSSSNTSKVIRPLSSMNNKSFKTNDVWL